MSIASLVRGLGRNDARQVGRDSFLRWILLFPLITAVLLRFAAEPIRAQLADRLDVQIYFPLAVSYMLMEAIPLLTGVVVGFLLLDERDEQTIKALLVTPLPMGLYLAYRVAAPILLSVGMIMLTVPISGVVTIGFWDLLAVALVMACAAPWVALFLVAFASDKVQGFAQMKIIGTLAIIPVVAYFLEAPWNHLLGTLMPFYWPMRAFWAVTGGGALDWPALTIGLLINGALTALLARRFLQVIHE